LDAGKIVSVIGPRRAGKTYLLRHLINSLLERIPGEQILYINFEDERLSLGTDDLQTILDAYLQLYPQLDLHECFLFFDEIQVVPGWQEFVRRIEETVTKRIFLTGSSAKLLSREIATTLRGRTISYTLLPLSFREYARFSGLDTEDRDSTVNRNLLARAFDQFVTQGGYPETVAADENVRLRTLQAYVDIMIYRDVIERHGLRQAHWSRT